MPSTVSMSSSTIESIESSLEKLILHEDDTANDATIHDANEEIHSEINEVTKLCGVTHKDYEFHSTYSSLELTKKAIDQCIIGNQYWTRGGKYQTNYGDKILYTCRSFAKCPKKMYLLLDPENQDVHAFVSTDDHHHDTFCKQRLNPLSKQKVLDLIGSGVVQPRKLLKELEKHKLPLLTINQINNLKARLKNKVNNLTI